MSNNKKGYKGKKKNFWDNFRFEFVLYINEQKKKDAGEEPAIICQRLFDVRGYNKQVLNSYELKELMDNLTSVTNNGLNRPGIIPNFFKELSKEICWKTYNPYRIKTREENKNMFENEDVFTFEIKVDKKVVAKSQFSGNWFQTDIRYAVNIRDIIPDIIDEIKEYFSKSQYTSMYNDVDLKFEFAPYDFEVN